MVFPAALTTAGGATLGGKVLGGLAALELLNNFIGTLQGPAQQGLMSVAQAPVPQQGSKGRYMITAQDELQIRDYLAKENFRRSFLRALPGNSRNPDFQPINIQDTIRDIEARAGRQAMQLGAREYAIEQLKTQAAIQPAYAQAAADIIGRTIYQPDLDPASLSQIGAAQ